VHLHVYLTAKMCLSPRCRRLHQILYQESTAVVYIWRPAHPKTARQCNRHVRGSKASRGVALAGSSRTVYRKRILTEPIVVVWILSGGPPMCACTRHATTPRHIEKCAWPTFPGYQHKFGKVALQKKITGREAMLR
jgi:hypothetical protein